MVQTMQAQTRECVVCGSFYPSNPQELRTMVDEALQKAKTFEKKEVAALIVPHAGYVFSASVAAQAYKTLSKKYKTIFLLGSSHHVSFDGVSIYTQGDYTTPLGKVKVNTQLAQELVSHNDFITYEAQAHTKEHTLEVQLPFLQTLYKDDFEIVPIIIASSHVQVATKLAEVLEPYFEDENTLFIISTDLSHYPPYKEAQQADKRTLEGILSNKTQTFIQALIENEEAHIPQLATSACGWMSVLTLLTMTQNKHYTYELLEYKNSGDSIYGEKDRVVGYGALRVYKEHATPEKTTEFFLTDEEKQQLKEIAKLSLYEAVLHDTKVTIDTSKLSKKLQQPLGAFVTLHKNGQLRGCIGRFEPDEPLYKVIIDMAIAASRYDTRFQPVQAHELDAIDIEISVLTPRKKVDSVDDVIVGKHGIYIEYQGKNGTYLPQVATDMGWDNTTFVQSCCVEKAGIPPQHCKDATLYVYEAIVF